MNESLVQDNYNVLNILSITEPNLNELYNEDLDAIANLGLDLRRTLKYPVDLPKDKYIVCLNLLLEKLANPHAYTYKLIALILMYGLKEKVEAAIQTEWFKDNGLYGYKSENEFWRVIETIKELIRQDNKLALNCSTGIVTLRTVEDNVHVEYDSELIHIIPKDNIIHIELHKDNVYLSLTDRRSLLRIAKSPNTPDKSRVLSDNYVFSIPLRSKP